MKVSKLIIDNVRDTKIADFLRNNSIQNNNKKNICDWLEDALNDQRVQKNDIEKILYEQLMYGQRNLIRIYSMKECRKLCNLEYWNHFIEAELVKQDVFCDILGTIPKSAGELQLAAVQYEEQVGMCKKIELLFVYCAEHNLRMQGNSEHIFSYIPVVFDLEKRRLIMKVRNRTGLPEEDLPYKQFDIVLGYLQENFEFTIEKFSVNTQKVLYRMSDELFKSFFKCLPNQERFREKEAQLDSIVNIMLEGLSLNQVYIGENNYQTIDDNVINLKEEVYKLIQQVALLDYFSENDSKEFLTKMKQYISRIRFSDTDNLNASLSNESDVKCIFDTKTFLSIRNSLELVKKVTMLCVTFPRERGNIVVKYEAVNEKFLTIHILNERYYSNEDFDEIMELYKHYETIENGKITAKTQGPAA